MWVLIGGVVSDPCLRQTPSGIHHIFDSERNLSLFSFFVSVHILKAWVHTLHSEI